MTREHRYSSQQNFEDAVTAYPDPHCFFKDCTGVLRKVTKKVKEFAGGYDEYTEVSCPICGYKGRVRRGFP